MKYPVVKSLAQSLVTPLHLPLYEAVGRGATTPVPIPVPLLWTPAFRSDGFSTTPDFHAVMGDTIEIECMASAVSTNRYAMLIDDNVSSTSFFGIEGNKWVASRYTFTVDGLPPVIPVPLNQRLKIVLTSTDANNIIREIGSFINSYPWLGQIYSIKMNHNSRTPPVSIDFDFTQTSVTQPPDTDLVIGITGATEMHTVNIINWGNVYGSKWFATSPGTGAPPTDVRKLLSATPTGLQDGTVAKMTYSGHTFYVTPNHPEYGIYFGDHMFLCDQYGRPSGVVNTNTPNVGSWQIETTQLVNSSDYKLQFADDAPAIVVGSNNIVFNNDGMSGTAYSTEKISNMLYRGSKVRLAFTLSGAISGDSLHIYTYGFGAIDTRLIAEPAVNKDYLFEFEMGDGTNNYGSDEMKIAFEVAVGVLAHYTISNISITVDPEFNYDLKGFSSPVWVEAES